MASVRLLHWPQSSRSWRVKATGRKQLLMSLERSMAGSPCQSGRMRSKRLSYWLLRLPHYWQRITFSTRCTKSLCSLSTCPPSIFRLYSYLANSYKKTRANSALSCCAHVERKGYGSSDRKQSGLCGCSDSNYFLVSYSKTNWRAYNLAAEAGSVPSCVSECTSCLNFLVMKSACSTALIQQVFPKFYSPLYLVLRRRRLYQPDSSSTPSSRMAYCSYTACTSVACMRVLASACIQLKNRLEWSLRQLKRCQYVAYMSSMCLQQELREMGLLSACLQRLAVNSSTYSPQKRYRLLRPIMKCLITFRYCCSSSVLCRESLVNSFLIYPLKTCKGMLYRLKPTMTFHSFMSSYTTILPAPKLPTVRSRCGKSIVYKKSERAFIHISKNEAGRLEDSSLARSAARLWCLSGESRGNLVAKRSKSRLQTLIISMLFSLLSQMRKEFIFLARSYANSALSPSRTSQLVRPCNFPQCLARLFLSKRGFMTN